MEASDFVIGIVIILLLAVGLMADAKGRSWFLWVLISLFISPPIAIATLFLLPNLRNLRAEPIAGTAFEAHGVYAGIPFRKTADGSVEAMLQGRVVLFRDMDTFTRAVT